MMTAHAWTTDCVPPSRFWIIPVAIVGTLFAVAVVILLLGWTGVILLPPFGGTYPPFWLVFPLGFVLVWVVVILGIRPWRWRNSWGWGREWLPLPDPGSVVRVRFARGEITKEQMTNLLRDLDETSRPIGREQSP